MRLIIHHLIAANPSPMAEKSKRQYDRTFLVIMVWLKPLAALTILQENASQAFKSLCPLSLDLSVTAAKRLQHRLANSHKGDLNLQLIQIPQGGQHLLHSGAQAGEVTF